jgi:hypothetical protein
VTYPTSPDHRRDPTQEFDEFAGMTDSREVRPIRNLNLHEEDDGWYGTRDHHAWENLYEQARDGAGMNDLELADPPAGTIIPGLGEI